jgi:D-3-phosphoglycerate dehydrogenase
MNTPDANTISTAEQTMTLMLALSRHVPKADAHVREKKWERKGFTGTQLAGKTLGIVGLGRVGSAVARRALSPILRTGAEAGFRYSHPDHQAVY